MPFKRSLLAVALVALGASSPAYAGGRRLLHYPTFTRDCATGACSTRPPFVAYPVAPARLAQAPAPRALPSPSSPVPTAYRAPASSPGVIYYRSTWPRR